MATVTTINRRTDLVDTQSLTYIRPITLTIKITNCKPLARLYPFFDGYRVDEYIEQAATLTSVPSDVIDPLTGFLTRNTGGAITTDSNGSCVVFFYIPGFKFTTGKKNVIFSESPDYIPGVSAILGSTYGSVSGEFTSTGVKQFYKETVTTVNDITIENVSYQTIAVQEQPWRPNVDPIAQSFNTFGITGGCFVTSIDVYFAAKDATIPVTLELREMVNGYPGPTIVSSYSRVTLNPSQVSTSSIAATPTKFTFSNMVYLLEDKEYCFVLLTNSTKYDLFSGIIGEISLETGKRVFEQAQLGSIFKSQNNSTWTADQFEDVKFTIFVAEFNTATAATIPMVGTAAPISMLTDSLTTTNGSNTIRARLTYKHALEVGSKIKIAVNPKGTYNGIVAANFVGSDYGNWPVTNIVSEYEFDFTVGANATSSGTIVHGTSVVSIQVLNGGSGYTSAPAVTITGTGAGATAVAVIENGVVTLINIINAGSGYTVAPSVSIVGSPGAGAVATSSINSSFTLVTNRLTHSVSPQVANFVPSGTNIRSTLKTTVANYPNGGLTTYSAGLDIPVDLNTRTDTNQNILVGSKTNELYSMSGNNSSVLELVLTSNNKNVSPVIDVSSSTLLMSNNNVNKQFGETITNITTAYGTLASVTVTNGGSGYSVAPSVQVVSADRDAGTGATAHATISGGVVTLVTIDTAGSGYTSPPSIVFTGSHTTGAVATTTLTDFNTELSPYSGRSFSKYFTKINTLETVSKGIRVLVNAYSSNNTDFDFYIRTSLSSEFAQHKDKNWTNLTCDVSRNFSRSKSEYLDYTFYNNNLGPFDTFDLKIVLKTKVPFDVPVIKNYRAIVIV